MSDNKKMYLEVQMFEKINEIIQRTGKYIIHPIDISSIVTEFYDVEEGEYRTFLVAPIWMTEQAYRKIPEFTGF